MPRESVYYKVNNLNTKHDLKQIKQNLDALPGISSVSVDLQEHKVAVDFDNTGVTHSQIENSLSILGYEITKTSSETLK